MITFPTFTTDTKGYIQGPTKAFVAPYVSAGADPSTNTLRPLGYFDKSGWDFDLKRTVADVESDQSIFSPDSFLTKAELDVKVTLQQLDPVNLAFALSIPSTSLEANPSIIHGGTPFDINSPSGIPTTRMDDFAFFFCFPSPGYDQSTTPKGAWAYLHLFKAKVVASGAVKFSKDVLASAQVTIRAYADSTISDASRNVYKWVYPS